MKSVFRFFALHFLEVILALLIGGLCFAYGQMRREQDVMLEQLNLKRDTTLKVLQVETEQTKLLKEIKKGQ